MTHLRRLALQIVITLFVFVYFVKLAYQSKSSSSEKLLADRPILVSPPRWRYTIASLVVSVHIAAPWSYSDGELV